MDKSRETLGQASPAESQIETHGADFNTASSQRQRILNHLATVGPLTTLDARRELDIFHPAGRVQELRQQGHDIITNWSIVNTKDNQPHKIARYVLLKHAVENVLAGTV